MKKIFISFVSFLAFSNIHAQDYYFQTVQEPYTDLQSATALSSGILWDDENIFPIALPFSFSANGNSIDSIFVTSNGVSSQNFYTYTDGDPIMSVAFSDAEHVDMGMLNMGTVASPISYKTETEDGKEVLIVEFKNAAFYEDTLSSDFDFVNVQIKLVDDNSVQIHYGPSQISAPEKYFSNEMGNIIGFLPDYENNDTSTTLNADAYILEGDPTSPNVLNALAATGSTQPGLDSAPPNGRKYIFSTDSIPLSVENYDISEIQIENPINNHINIVKGKDQVKSLELCNVNGQIIYGTDEALTDVSSISSGLYLIKITDKEGKLYIKKVIKN